MKHKITINALAMTSVYDALFDLNKFRKKLERLATELPQVLAYYGRVGASVRFAEAPYNIFPSGQWDHPHIKVTAEEFSADDRTGWRILADGKDVCFVEFGAGVYYTGGNSAYLGRRPRGIVGIGQYGEGHGKQDMWVFKDKSTGEKVFTHGTPASNAMFYTSQELRNRIAEEAGRILNE